MVQKKLSQKDQVIAAMVKIGGQGTLATISKTLENSGIKIIKANISSILCTGKEFRKDESNDKVWIYEDSKSFQNTVIKNTIDNTKVNTLYVITVSDCVQHLFAGLPFKVGKSEKELKARLKAYNQSLPFETIQFICSYTIQLPDGINLIEVETSVHNELKKLVRNDYLGFGIMKLQGGNQKDWFTAKNLQSKKQEDKNKLVMAIDKIIRDNIKKMRKTSDGN
jgi:hypothetical protein